MPSESMRQLAATTMQPPLMADLHLTPFSPASVPSSAMVLWAVGYTLVALVAALQGFGGVRCRVVTSTPSRNPGGPEP